MDIQGIQIEVAISRKEFESYISHHLVAIDQRIDRFLADNALETTSIDVVVTTGGSSLIPCVQSMLYRKFGKEKVVFHDTFEGVAAGLARSDILLK